MVKKAALALFLLGLWLILTAPASGNHSGPLLPYVPNTPLMQTIMRTGEYTWCVNDTAAAYPGFVDQLRDVNDQYTARVGVRQHQVAWGTLFGVTQRDASGNLIPQTGCMVQHNFIIGLECGGCAAHVYYTNWPVVVEYKADLSYQDWRSTSGHELGHAVLGLHEQYDDIAFRCLPERTWTVMSCGTGVRYPQAFDVTWGCSVLDPNSIQFVGCGYQEPEPVQEWGSCDTDGVRVWCWNNWDQLWHWTIWEPTDWRFDPNDPARGWYCVEGCP